MDDNGAARLIGETVLAQIQSLARGLKILDHLTDAARDPARGAASITELAGVLGVNKSSASRLVQTLVAAGYVKRAPASRRYQLGPKVQRVGDPAGGRPALRELARPFLYLLMKQSGECAHTAVYAQNQALIIDDVESASSLRVAGGVGRLNLLHCTAVGKSLLAFSEAPLPEALVARTDRTLTSRSRLRRHLDEIRRQGYAFDDEENELGVRCLAAPVFDHDAEAIACLGISGPTVRMSLERVPELAEIVLEACRELSAILGHRGPLPSMWRG